MIVLVVNNNRYLINEQSPACEKMCKQIIKAHPASAVVEFDEVRKSDVVRKKFF